MEEKSKWFPRDLLILSFSFFFIFMGAGAQQQFLIPYLRENIGLGAMKASALLSSVYISITVWRVFIGYTMELLGTFRSILFGSLTYTAFAATIFLTDRFEIMLIAAIVWGWGAASMWIGSSNRVLDVTGSGRYGFSTGLFYLCTHIGFTIGLVILGNVGSMWGSRWIYGAASAITLIGNLAMFSISKVEYGREKPDFRKVLSVLKGRKAKVVSFLQFSSSISFGILLSVFADFITEEYGFGYLYKITILFYISRGVLSFTGGTISDRLGRASAFFWAFFLSGIGLLTAAVWESPIGAGLAALALGLQNGLVPTISMAFVGDVAEKGKRYMVLGAIFLWRDIAVAIGILFGQYLRIVFRDFSSSFLTFSAIFIACALVSVKLSKYEDERL